MNKNDILIRLRYALNLQDTEMIEIFKLGGVDVTEEEIKKILVKSAYHDEEDTEDEFKETEDYIKIDNIMFESFLNGLIILKRGKQEPQPGKPEGPVMSITGDGNVNNVLLKKVKIALSLTSDDMHDIFEKAGITVSKSELSAVFRKEGQRNYKECGDRYARNFLKGLAIKLRK